MPPSDFDLVAQTGHYKPNATILLISRWRRNNALGSHRQPEATVRQARLRPGQITAVTVPVPVWPGAGP